jgi:hypothetical protein
MTSICKISTENLAHFSYFGVRVTNKFLDEEKMKRILNSGNAWYHSVQNRLSSRPLPEHLKL